MTTRIGRAVEQLTFLVHDLRRITNGRRWRWLTAWFGSGAWTVVSYRLDRAGYLLVGGAWAGARLLLFPLFALFRLLGASGDIPYRAEIGPGLLILHVSLGCVINRHAVIGRDLVLTGGNCIGARSRIARGDLVLGDGVSLGANAVVLGPVRLGNRVSVGAGAVVVRDAADGEVLVGAPAEPVAGRTGSDAERLVAR